MAYPYQQRYFLNSFCTLSYQFEEHLVVSHFSFLGVFWLIQGITCLLFWVFTVTISIFILWAVYVCFNVKAFITSIFFYFRLFRERISIWLVQKIASFFIIFVFHFILEFTIQKEKLFACRIHFDKKDDKNELSSSSFFSLGSSSYLFIWWSLKISAHVTLFLANWWVCWVAWFLQVSFFFTLKHSILFLGIFVQIYEKVLYD